MSKEQGTMSDKNVAKLIDYLVKLNNDHTKQRGSKSK